MLHYQWVASASHEAWSFYSFDLGSASGPLTEMLLFYGDALDR